MVSGNEREKTHFCLAQCSLRQPVPLRLITIATPQTSRLLPIRPRSNFRVRAAIRVVPTLVLRTPAGPTRVPRTHVRRTRVQPTRARLAITRAVRIHVVRDIILVRQARVAPIPARPTIRVPQAALAALPVRAVALTPVVCDRLTLAPLHHAAPIPAPHSIRVARRPVPRLRARQRQVTHVLPAIRVRHTDCCNSVLLDQSSSARSSLVRTKQDSLLDHRSFSGILVLFFSGEGWQWSAHFIRYEPQTAGP